MTKKERSAQMLSSPDYIPRLPISTFSPGAIKSKIEYVARLCILDNHGRLPEPVGVIHLMMDYQEAGRPGRNFFIGNDSSYTWNCLNWGHFPPGYLENLEQQQPLLSDDPAFEPVPRLGVAGGNGKKLLSWITRRIAERDFQPGRLEDGSAPAPADRLPAASFLASPLDRDKKTQTSIPTEWAYFRQGEHIQDYTDLEDTATIDAIIEAHPHGSTGALRMFIAITRGVNITVSHIQGVRRASTAAHAAAVDAPTIALTDLWDTVWGDEEEVYQVHSAWKADERIEWAMETFVGITGNESQEEQTDDEMQRPTTRSHCSVATCLFHDYEMRWETDPRDANVVMCRFHSRTVSILQRLGWTKRMIDIALVNNNQLADTSYGRLLANVFSFVACGHATCKVMGIPGSGICADPIGIELGVCDSCRKERKYILEQQGDRQRALTQIEAFGAFEHCATCGRGTAPAGKLSFSRRRDFFGYANKNGDSICRPCFLKAGGIDVQRWAPRVGPKDHQEIDNCIREIVKNEESMDDLMPRFCWRLLQDKSTGIPVGCAIFMMRKAAGLDDF